MLIAVVPDVAPRQNKQMWKALKTRILRERQRKKQEQEANAAEGWRQRMTVLERLREINNQSEDIRNEITRLQNVIHQLYMHLEELNAEENNLRKLIKE